MKKTNPTLHIDSESFAREVFHLKDNSVRKSINEFIQDDNSAFNQYFRLVCRYLVHNVFSKKDEKNEIYNLKKVLINYSFVFASICYFDDDNDNPFNDLLNDGLTVESLLNLKTEKDDFVSNVFNKYYDCNEKVDDYMKQIKDNLPVGILKRKTELVKKIVNNNYNFFSSSYKYNDWLLGTDTRTPIDLLLADELSSKKPFIKFDFDLEDRDNFNMFDSNVEGKEKGHNYDLIAFLIDAWLNTSSDDGIPMYPYILYKILTNSITDHMSFCSVLFIPENEAENQNIALYHINTDLLSPFNFTYNGVKYEFSIEGIKTRDDNPKIIKKMPTIRDEM